MSRILLFIATFLLAAPAAAQVTYPPPAPVDLSGLMPRAEAETSIAQINASIATKASSTTTYTKTQVDGLLGPVASNAQSGAASAPYARVKWAGAALQTDATGVRVLNIPANKMTTGVACGITIRTTGAFSTPTCVPVGSPSTGYTVTVTFTKLKNALTIPAVVLGAAAAILPLIEPMQNTGIVTFDITASEPDINGP